MGRISISILYASFHYFFFFLFFLSLSGAVKVLLLILSRFLFVGTMLLESVRARLSSIDLCVFIDWLSQASLRQTLLGNYVPMADSSEADYTQCSYPSSRKHVNTRDLLMTSN